MQLVRSEVRRNCMAATAAPQFAAHQWGCQRRRQLRARHRCVFSWRNRRRERKHDECREPWWWSPLGSRRERVLKVLPHIESAVQFKVSSSTSPGAYFGPRPWLFGATVVASVLQKIPGAEATLSETQFSAEQEDALLRFPDCNFAILNDASGLDEDEVVIKHDRDSAVFLPRTREHLEAAAYIAWRACGAIASEAVEGIGVLTLTRVSSKEPTIAVSQLGSGWSCPAFAQGCDLDISGSELDRG